jgi:ABC-type sugar transport system ATPase subunit
MGKAFGGVPVLRGVDFDLRAGEVHVLAGENGAGKSTLIKILAGVHTEYEGEIRMAGRPVRFRSRHEASGRGISVIHQELSLVNAMSVVDNLFLGEECVRAGFWVDNGAQRARARALLAPLGLDVDLFRPVEDYPVSTRQMIEIAKALAFNARVFVMDEPTSALTDPEVERLFEIIGDLKRRGCGIIYISHRLEEIYRVADRITVLRDGEHIGTAPAAELPQPKLVAWMVGREISQHFPERPSRFGAERLAVRDFSVPDPVGIGRRVVEDVSFSVRAGEVLGFAGLQGSGNSELFNGLFGAYGRLGGGTVRLDGRPLAPTSPSRSIREGLALLTNDRKRTGRVGSLTIRENITLASLPRFSPGGWLRRGREAEAGERHRGSLAIRSASLEQEVLELSGGNQQKTVLAKWLETQPKVLLLDEPTRGVDVGAKHDIYELMNAWTAQGMAILLITSEMPELLAMSDRIVVMHRGRIAGEFGRGASQEEILRAAMGGTGGGGEGKQISNLEY